MTPIFFPVLIIRFLLKAHQTAEVEAGIGGKAFDNSTNCLWLPFSVVIVLVLSLAFMRTIEQILRDCIVYDGIIRFCQCFVRFLDGVEIVYSQNIGIYKFGVG